MRITIAVSITLALLLPAQAVASKSELRLKILPTDCIFEIINDGSGELRYITPEECGELIDAEPVENAPQGPNGNAEPEEKPNYYRNNPIAYETDTEDTNKGKETASQQPNNDSASASPAAPSTGKSRFAFIATTVVLALLFVCAIAVRFTWHRKNRSKS